MIKIHPEILSKDGKPQFVLLPYEEFLQVQAALAKADETNGGSARLGGFYDNLDAAEQARRQGVKPADDLNEYRWPHGPEDWEGFAEAVEEWRYGKGGE